MSKNGKRDGSRRAGVSVISLVFALAVLIISAHQAGWFQNWPEAGGASPAFSPNEDQSPLLVYFLDVGQGDSQLIRIPGETGYFNLLLDTGEYKYADGLAQTLRELGVETIDALVCSHPHTDHMGCMARMVQWFEVGSVYMPLLPKEQTPTSSAYEALLDRVEEKNLVITQLYAGAQIAAPGAAQFQVLAPRKDQDWEEVNNYSAVIRLEYGETTFLFTGDAEQDSEEEILEDGYLAEADVLKCGHHGSSSSTSQEFLEAVSPRYAVISCGEGNRYGHPHKETLETLESQRGLTVFRTDQDGTVLFQSDGETLTCETDLPSVPAKES